MSWNPHPPSPGPDLSGLPLRQGPDAADVQGNVLAGFNKDHMTFVLLQLPTEPARARAWLFEVVPQVATTAQVEDFNERFSRARRATGGTDPENLRAVWLNVALTRSGLEILSADFARLERDLAAVGAAYLAGAASRADALGDLAASGPAKWLFGGTQGQRIDAVVTVAADRRADRRSRLRAVRRLAAQHGLFIVFEQDGDTLPGDRAGHEHFGFKDGISQPGVEGFHEPNPDRPTQRRRHLGSDLIKPGEFVLGWPSEDGASGDEIPTWLRNSSFQVLRRLRQDVPGFWAQVEAAREEDAFGAQDLLAAKLVGRWRSGTPLARAPEHDSRSTHSSDDDNEFDFSDDSNGHKTPRFAHIRKTFPRGVDQFSPRSHRMLRRGIPFGDPFDPTSGRGQGIDAERGLIFQCFVADIERQFEFMQQAWANNAGFPQDQDGPDPVIGANEAGASVTLKMSSGPDEQLSFKRFVHTQGSVYGLAPSLTTLRALASGDL